jgi:hypothetical protein
MHFIWFACAPVTVKDMTEGSFNADTASNPSNSDDQTQDSGVVSDSETEDFDDILWSNSQLLVLSPQPSSFHPINETTPFEAQIIADNGDVLEFDEIEWQTSIDNTWLEVGTNVEAVLPVGQQVVTATAHLPNGDRLSYAVGGILVQHPNTGTYVGTTIIDLTINTDQSFVVSCAGSATLSVDSYGEIAAGESSCILNLNGNDIDSSYQFDLILDESEITGEAIVDLWLIQQGFPFTGTVETGTLTGNWSESVLGGYLDIAGELELERVSIYPLEGK